MESRTDGIPDFEEGSASSNVAARRRKLSFPPWSSLAPIVYWDELRDAQLCLSIYLLTSKLRGHVKS